MKLKGKEIGIIIILFGVLIVLGTYSFYFKDNRDQVREISQQESELKKDVDRLKNLESQADKIQAQINASQTKLNKLMNLFPADVKYEDGILFLDDVTSHNDVKISGYTITEANPEASVDEQGNLVANTATDATAEQSVGSGYTLSTGNVQFDFETDYDNLKKMIRYIYGYGTKRKGLNNITINKDEDGKLKGTASVDMYALTDGNREYTPEKNDDVKTGNISNVFGK